MDMKNVKNVDYWQIDHRLKNVSEREGAIVMPSPKAWEKFSWVKKYFLRKPEEGYFVWLKKEGKNPLTTCLTIASPNISQKLNNLLVIEEGIKVKINGFCNAQKNNLRGSHIAQGKIIIKKGASLEYNHCHQWGENDSVETDYRFILEENSSLNYNYKNLFPPKKLRIKTFVFEDKNSSSELDITIRASNTKIDIKDNLVLKGKNSQGIVRLKLVGGENSEIKAKSSIVAKEEVRGHLDCQGLLISESAKIFLTPELICQNKMAQITHEASIGRISEEELIYLRTRGLNEKEAIGLIVNGFLVAKK